MPPIPKCNCGQPCLSKEAFKGDNRGKWYWICRTRKCKFFTWNDPGHHLYTPIIHTPVNTINNDTGAGLRYGVIQQKREPAPFTITEAECPLVPRKSRLANPGKRRTLNNTKTVIQLSLYTTTDICIQAEGKHSYIQSLLTTLPWVAWVEQKKMWVFPAAKESYIPVWNLMKQHRATFEVTGVPNAVLRLLPNTKAQVIESALQRQHDDDITSLDYMGSWFQQEAITSSNLWQSMTLDQRTGMKKGVKLAGNIYMEDPIGSGKSLQALGVALVHQDKWPALIVCTVSKLMVWKNLIKEMLSMDSQDICLLDPLPFLKGKLVYSDKPKAVKSRIYRRRQRKLLLQLQEGERQHNTNGIPSSASSMTISSTPSISTVLSSPSSSSSLLSPMSPKDSIPDEIDDIPWFIDLKNDSGDSFKHSRKKIDKRLPKGKTALATPTHHHSLMNNITQKRSYDISNTDGDAPNIDRHTPSINGNMYIDLEKLDKEFDLDMGLGYDIDSTDDSNDDDDDDDINFEDTTSTNLDNAYDSMDASADPNDELGEFYNQEILHTAQFCIVSYDKAKTRLRALATKKFKVVIFDDCQVIKRTMMPTYKSALQRLVNATDKTIMVSGNSVLDKPMEAYPLLRILKPNLFVDYKYFGHRYCGARHLVFGWDYTGKSNSEELRFLLEKTVLVH